jgi:aminomethyltransferase
MAEPSAAAESLERTPLYDAHVALGGRMVPFAGYEMPVQYEGILAEHLHTRAAAGLFDVSHMGQAVLRGPDFDTVARALETLIPGEATGLFPGQQKYSQLLADDGGILDDLMVTRPPEDGPADELWLVVNASRKAVDYAHIRERLPAGITLEPRTGDGLIALQGPKAAEVLAMLIPGVEHMDFMAGGVFTVPGEPATVRITRSGYTGEDGYEIGAGEPMLSGLWARLLDDHLVKPIGLGARDSLRLEAGLCLYGHDIDETTSPVEAGLVWSIPKRRRTADAGFPGAARIAREIAEGPSRRRVGLKPEGRAPAREGAEIVQGGKTVGTLTSGGFGPSVGGPVAMGYVAAGTDKDAPLDLLVRGKPLPARIVPMPFVPNRYHRKAGS